MTPLPIAALYDLPNQLMHWDLTDMEDAAACIIHWDGNTVFNTGTLRGESTCHQSTGHRYIVSQYASNAEH